MDKKQYYKEYYQNNKKSHNDRMKKYRNDNKNKLKKYYHNYYNDIGKEKWEQKKEDNIDLVREQWNKAKKKTNRKKRNYVNNHKKDKFCLKCNESRFYCLDFHHIDPSTKLFSLGDAPKYSYKKIDDEINKCVLICRNCHSEFHYLEKENGILFENYIKGI